MEHKSRDDEPYDAQVAADRAEHREFWRRRRDMPPLEPWGEQQRDMPPLERDTRYERWAKRHRRLAYLVGGVYLVAVAVTSFFWRDLVGGAVHGAFVLWRDQKWPSAWRSSPRSCSPSSCGCAPAASADREHAQGGSQRRVAPASNYWRWWVFVLGFAAALVIGAVTDHEHERPRQSPERTEVTCDGPVSGVGMDLCAERDEGDPRAAPVPVVGRVLGRQRQVADVFGVLSTARSLREVAHRALEHDDALDCRLEPGYGEPRCR